MADKDKYFFLEALFSFFLVYIAVGLFGTKLSVYKLYLIFGSIGGIIFSYYVRNSYARAIKYVTVFSLLLVTVWLFYSILNSSFIYKDVIIICIKGLILLEILFSFNTFTPPFLTYIQVLSIPLFMSHFVFLKGDYNETSLLRVLCYVIVWFVILKLKFYELFKPVKKSITGRNYSILFSAVSLTLILLFAWLLSYALPLGQIRKGGLFTEEDTTEESGLEKEYYKLQDQAQKEINVFLPMLSNNKDRHDFIRLLGALVKEATDTLEVARAELGLVTRIQQTGPGIEKKSKEDLTILMHSYVDKKTQLNFKRIKDKIMDILRQNPFNIKNRISIFSLINKIQHSNSHKDVTKQIRALKNVIDNSSLQNDKKEELTELVRSFKEWKILDLYRKATNNYNQDNSSLEKDTQNELAGISENIRRSDELTDFKQADKRLGKLKESADSKSKNPAGSLQKILDLKLEMLLSKKTNDLKEKVDTLNLSKDKLSKMKQDLDNIKEAQDYNDLARNFNRFQEVAATENLGAPEEIRDLLETKIYLLVKERKEKISELLKESILSQQQKQDFISSIERLELTKDKESLVNEAKKLRNEIERMQKQGYVYLQVKDDLMKQVEELVSIKESQAQIKQNKLYENADEQDMQTGLEQMIEEMSIKEESKERLERLIKELSLADSLSRIEEISQALESEMNSAGNQEVKLTEKEKFNKAFQEMVRIKRIFTIDQTLLSLIKNIERLHNVDQEESRKLDQRLRELRKSITEEELKKKLNALKEYMLSKKFNEQDADTYQENDPSSRWQVRIMPSYLLMPTGSSVSLKSIAIYNNLFIKELSLGPEWFSSNPDVVWVDQKGGIRSLSKGIARIGLIYKGKITEGAEVIVVDKMDEQDVDEIKRHLTR